MNQATSLNTAPRARIAWFNCFAGISGDMALGALLDAGASIDAVRGALEGLSVPGWTLGAEQTMRGGLAALRAVVGTSDPGIPRNHASIAELLGASSLEEGVKRRALAVFAALADAEGRLHREDPSKVHFHEVGSLDAIVDVVGVCAALADLGVGDVACSSVALGTGTVRCSHGLLPNPAPAVVELLRGMSTHGIPTPYELTTPTGAALLAGLSASCGPQPAMVGIAAGYGAGSRDLDEMPNVCQVVIGDAVEEGPSLSGGQPVVLLETNLDDVTGEVLAGAAAAALAEGAFDAWISDAVMKKGRPAHVLHVLCDPALVSGLVELIRHQTASPGVRAQTLTRWAAPRKISWVEVGGHKIGIKHSRYGAKPEHDDAAAAALALGVPLRAVLDAARREWDLNGGNGGEDAQGVTG